MLLILKKFYNNQKISNEFTESEPFSKSEKLTNDFYM